MADSSFDVVSKIDRMELDNAINQAIREIDTRFDFKNTGAKIEMAGEKINIEADTEERAKATLDVIKDKMIKRGVSLKHMIQANHNFLERSTRSLAHLKKVSLLRTQRRSLSFYGMRVQSQLNRRSKAMSCAYPVRAAMTCRPLWR